MPTPHYRIEPISRGSVRNGKVRRPASLGGSMAARIVYITRGGDLASRADEVISHGSVGPQMNDWSRVDRAEIRKDAIVGRELESTVPHLLSHEAMTRIARAHANEISELLNVPVYYGVHHASRTQGSDWRNTHVHFAWPARQVNAEGQLGDKTRVLDNRNTSGAVVAQLRGKYQDLVNRELAAAALDERLDLRSFAARGLSIEPQRRVPKLEFQRARRGEIYSPRYARNQALIRLRTTTAAVAHAAASFTRTCRNLAAGIVIRRRAARVDRRRTGGRGMDRPRIQAPAARGGFPRNRRDRSDHRDSRRSRPVGTGVPADLAAAGPGGEWRGDSVPTVDTRRIADRDRSGRARASDHAQMAARKDRPEPPTVTLRVAVPAEDSLITKIRRWFTGAARRGTSAEQIQVEAAAKEVEPQIEQTTAADMEPKAAQETEFAERVADGLRAVATTDDPLIKIRTRPGTEYFMRRVDWIEAQVTGATDVALCEWNGEPVEAVGGKRKTLRVSTVAKSELSPLKRASADELLHHDQEQESSLEL